MQYLTELPEKENDQVRFELGYLGLNPDITVYCSMERMGFKF